MKVVAMLGVVALAATVSAAYAQPNLSGTYVLDHVDRKFTPAMGADGQPVPHNKPGGPGGPGAQAPRPKPDIKLIV
jgi:hypothetical protein